MLRVKHFHGDSKKECVHKNIANYKMKKRELKHDTLMKLNLLTMKNRSTYDNIDYAKIIDCKSTTT